MWKTEQCTEGFKWTGRLEFYAKRKKPHLICFCVDSCYGVNMSILSTFHVEALSPMALRRRGGSYKLLRISHMWMDLSPSKRAIAQHPGPVGPSALTMSFRGHRRKMSSWCRVQFSSDSKPDATSILDFSAPRTVGKWIIFHLKLFNLDNSYSIVNRLRQCSGNKHIFWSSRLQLFPVQVHRVIA